MTPSEERINKEFADWMKDVEEMLDREEVDGVACLQNTIYNMWDLLTPEQKAHRGLLE